MAYIRKHGDGWRAEVQRNGQRASKKFPTKREAQQWALSQEGKSFKDISPAVVAMFFERMTEWQ